MSKKRDRLNVIYDILNIIRSHEGRIKPTPLLRYSNLSSQNFGKYLEELLEKGLVEEVEIGKCRREVKITEKGGRFLQKYRAIVDIIDEFNL